MVFLYGKMGVGKTTFIKHLINNFQKNNDLKQTEVTSPTFNLVNEYDSGDFVIHHYDLFRLKNIQEINNIGLFENIEKNLTLIEWPEKIEKMIKKRINLFFEYDNNFDRRFIRIQRLSKNEF